MESNKSLPQFLAESRERFEQNMLDGDKLESCGKAMLDAEEVWNHFEESLTAAYHLGGQAKENQFEDFIQTLIDKLREDANDERLNDFFRVNCREEINILKRLLSSLTKLKENEK